MYAIRQTTIDYRTGETLVRVLKKRWKTFRGAENYAQRNYRWITIPGADNKPVDESDAEVIRVGNGGVR